jgi:hypothetical protein
MLQTVLCAFAVAAVGQPPVQTPTLAEEKAAPFSYFLVPSDVVGFKDCPQGFQLTYDGALNNGFGEFQLLAGSDLSPINQRVRTLYKGCYPIPEFTFKRDGTTYKVKMWGAPKNLDPTENLIAYVRIEAKNEGTSTVSAVFGGRFAPRGDRSRHELPCREWYRDKFMNWNAWTTQNGAEIGGASYLNGHAVYAVDWPKSTGAAVGRGEQKIEDGEKPIGASKKVLTALYKVALKPKASCAVTFKVPYVPIDKTRRTEIDAFNAADADKAFGQVVAFWKGLFDRAATIEVPEQKVNDTLRASLAYILIARDVLEDGKHFMQTCNKFQYHSFYFRDGAYFVRAYDMLGLHDVAAETVEYYLETDPTGKPTDLKRIGQDDWGQSIWALAMHYRSTGDLAFVRRIAPVLAPHLSWLRDRLAEDPLGLFPKCGPYDNELLDGHYTGHSFWILLGLREGANMLKADGRNDEAAEWMKLHDEYRERFLAQLKKMTDQTGGYIPPGIDLPSAGRDWENATGGVYPFGVLPATDPRVRETVHVVREYKWREGISTWGTNGWVLKEAVRKGLDPEPGTLHHYQTYNTTETMLALDMQREVLEDVYSILAHTSSTHAGFEMSTEPWGARDTEGNYPPHGWMAARTIEMLRNMMVREEGDTLHLASALSPVWVQAGKEVRVKNLATNFGPVSFTLKAGQDGATVEFAAKWRSAPKTMLFHVPFFLKATGANVDGAPVAVEGGVVVVLPGAKRLELTWKETEKPDLSYARAVELWLEKNYNRTPGMDRNFLFPHPSRPRPAGPIRQFVGSVDLKLVAPDGLGAIHYTLDGSTPTPKSVRYVGPIRLTETTTVKAVTVWADGRISDSLELTVTKAVFREPAQVTGLKPGLKFGSFDWKGPTMPDFSTMTPAKTGIAPGFEPTEVQHQEDFYALRFTGYIWIPRDGVYTFTTGSDDGSRLLIGDERVVDNDGLHMYTEVLGDIPLKTGYYPIKVEFFNWDGAKYLRVFWEGPGVAKERIPATALFHGE